MRNSLIGFFSVAVFAPMLFGAEITTKELDDIINEVPRPGGHGLISREVSKVKGFYRGETLVLLEYNTELTLNLEGKESSVTESTRYFIVAEGQKILGINGGSFTIFFASSPWPIDISHLCHAKDEKGTGRSQICVPEIGFFEQIEFKDGILLPLIEGSEFEDFKEFYLKNTRKHLKKPQP